MINRRLERAENIPGPLFFEQKSKMTFLSGSMYLDDLCDDAIVFLQEEYA
jgi:hypothetical protein